MELSIVIPIYNEADSVNRLYNELKSSLDSLGRSYEIIAVDDGSSDKTFEKLSELHHKDSTFKVIQFRRNFGQTAAMSAGFDAAQGDVIVTLDADLQNPPSQIPKLLAEMEKGDFDVVSGWRQKRHDGFLRKLLSRQANRMIGWLTDVKLHDYGCSLKAYRKEVIKDIRLYGELHRFIPAVASQVGARITEVPVEHRSREFGKSKYGFSRILRVFLDLFLLKFLLTYSKRPIHFFGWWGLLSSGIGLIIAVYLAFVRIVLQESIGNRPLLIMSVLLMVLGVQFIMMGILGEITIRTYYESQGKKIYNTRKQLL